MLLDGSSSSNSSSSTYDSMHKELKKYMITTSHRTVCDVQQNTVYSYMCVRVCVFVHSTAHVYKHIESEFFDKKSNCPHLRNYNQIAIWNTGENIFVEYPFCVCRQMERKEEHRYWQNEKKNITKNCEIVDAKKTEAQTHANASYVNKKRTIKNRREKYNGCKDFFFLTRWQTWLVWMCALIHESIWIAHLILIKRSFLSQYTWNVCRVQCWLAIR